MIIHLVPQYGESQIEVVKRGDALTINGEVFDFSKLPEGATLPPGSVDSKYVVRDVVRKDGRVVLTLALPIQRSVFEGETIPPIVDPADGPVQLPVIGEVDDH